MSKYLLPGIIWGQHRTTELLALAVKEKLAGDQDLKRLKIPLVEYAPWKLSDYVERLYSS